MIKEMLHDPAFWYAVSFFLFVGVAAKKGLGFLNGALTSYQSGIQSTYDEARSLHEEAKKERRSVEKALKNWPKEREQLEKAHQERIGQLKNSFRESFERSREKRADATKKYIEFKRQEAQKRLESKVAEKIIQGVAKSFS